MSVDVPLTRVFAAVTERPVQDALIRLATRLGYRYYHTHLARHSPAGFPDLVFGATDRQLGGGPLLAFVECKREGRLGRLTPAQLAWGVILSAVERVTGGIVAYRVCRPSTYHEVAALLGGNVVASGPSGAYTSVRADGMIGARRLPVPVGNALKGEDNGRTASRMDR